MARPNLSLGRYDLALLLVVLIWGFNFPVMKTALAVMDPLVFNALRFSLTVVALGLIGSARRWSRGPRGERGGRPGDALRIFGLGLLGHVASQTMFITGLARTTSGSSALLISTSPIWTAVLGHLAGWDRLGRGMWLGLGIAFLGAGQLALAGPGAGLDLGGTATLGNVLTLGAALAWGSYTALSGPILRRHSALALAFWSALSGLPFMWLAAAPALDDFSWSLLLGPVGLALLYAGILASGLAYVLWNVGVHRVGPAQTAVSVYLVPVVALAAGTVWLDEPVNAAQVLGGVAIVAGLVWMRRRPVPPPE